MFVPIVTVCAVVCPFGFAATGHDDVRCAPATGVETAEAAGASWTGVPALDFFTGDGRYMPRVHCLVDEAGRADWLWIGILVSLTGGVVLWYARIFVFWMQCYFGERPEDRNTKLFHLAAIFLLCAICGYATSILMFIWPGYRLVAAFLLALNFFSWRFCRNLEPFRQAFASGRFQRELREETASRAEELERLLRERTAALHESETRFGTIIQNLPGVAFRIAVDENWTNLFVSDEIEAVTGYPATEFTSGARACASIVHPDDVSRLDDAVDAAIRGATTYSVEYRIFHRDGGVRWVLERGLAVVDDATGQPEYIDGLQFDITERKRAEEEAQRSSLVDRLTHLPNRSLLLARLRAMVCSEREEGRGYAVLFLDFDRFKVINDSLGHEAGDVLLRSIADRLRSVLRIGDASVDSDSVVVGRLGGDEFVVIMDDLEDPAIASRVAGRIVLAFREPHEVCGHRVVSTVSVGVVTDSTRPRTAESLLRDADTAMYRAKLAGKGRAVVFDEAMRESADERLLLEEELRDALAEEQFALAYQPIVSLETGEWVGAEALLRWNNPRRGMVSPAEFIPIAEESGLIVEIGEWVLLEAANQHMRWLGSLRDAAPRSISVNLSRSQLACADLPERLTRIMREVGLPAESLHLEITENQAASGGDHQVDSLRALRAIGVKLAMDDFGTGLSSLSGLHELPIDVLKIDRSFVVNLRGGKQFMALARSIIELAGNLGMTTTAEGIENPEDLTVLQALGCPLGQGFLFAPPMSGQEFERRLREQVRGRHAA